MIDNDKLFELVQEVQNGNKNSFWNIYDILLPNIYNFVYYKVQQKELAEDLTEEVFIKVWDNLSKFKFSDNIPFSAWVYRIAWNLIIDYFRKYKNEIPMDEEFDVEDNNCTIEDFRNETENSYNQKVLSKALSKLNIDQRDVIIFKYVNDLDYWEISIIMWKPEWTIRQLHSRAIKNLKWIIDECFK